ncbi:AAA family ATPase [Pseudomonas benzenivorans]|uniref:AAA family ATPase n=1 Tax=Pseudomonas benzenivorans TaxID=556533 RepID=A0ABZ0PUD3_9PSED|nr:AAA family ATPase [Pseudomonas benzenivorans]WPC04711.1 AAA family ATPase [Pseudomonas benzenivorans]
MTGIVGRNDYGKSTILEALAIFFESGDVKADKSDMNCFSLAEGDEQFEMACEFDGLPAVSGLANISWTQVVGGLLMPTAAQAMLPVVSRL